MPTVYRQPRRPLRERLPAGAFDLGLDGLLAAVVIAVCLAATVFHLETIGSGLLEFEHRLSDWRTAALADQHKTSHPGIAIVTIDEETMADSPYDVVDREHLARLLQVLERAGAKGVGLDIVFLKKTEDAKDRALLAAIKASRIPVVIAAADRRVTLLDHQRAYQRDFITASGQDAGYANLYYDRDEIIRRRSGPGSPPEFTASFVARLASIAGKADVTPGDRIAWLKQPADGGNTFFTLNAKLLLGNPVVAAALAPRLKDRIVLIGGSFADRDRHRVPLGDRDAPDQKVHGVFVHAQALAQLLDGRRIIGIPAWRVVLPIAFGGFLLGWSFRQRGFSWILGGGATAVIIALDILFYWQWRVALPYTPVTIAWFAGGLGGYVAGLVLRRPPRTSGEWT